MGADAAPTELEVFVWRWYYKYAAPPALGRERLKGWGLGGWGALTRLAVAGARWQRHWRAPAIHLRSRSPHRGGSRQIKAA